MTIRGFIDNHNHQFAHLGFGGIEFWGAPSGDIQTALPWCTSAHGAGGVTDAVGWVVRITYQGLKDLVPGHLVGGYPQFDGWPRYDSATHQTVYVDWLERAWHGGLRVLVMLAVNNEYMCSQVQKAPGRTCSDMEAVDLQLQAAINLEAEIDQAHGGPGRGWYRIVRDPAEARSTAEAGNLAVVLGIEVDHLFNSYYLPGMLPTTVTQHYPVLTTADVQAAVRKYYDIGVRYVFPVHFSDNQFGGTAYQNSLQAAYGIGIEIPTPFGVTFETPYILNTVDGTNLGYEMGTGGGRRNPRGLTDLGKTLISELMKLGILIDIDHMSYQTRSDTLDLAEANGYPVFSGHSGYIDVCRGDKRHEGQLTAGEVERIRRLGGMMSPIIAQGNLNQIATWQRPDGTSIPHVCGASANTYVQAYLYAVEKMQGTNVGIGTDFNGFAGVPGPVSGPNACSGGASGTGVHPVGLLSYPFSAIAADGAQMPRSQIGQKAYDINTDGLAHVGMLPDFVSHLQVMGVRDNELEPLLSSAESFVSIWERILRQEWQAAFQANTSNLWIVGQDNRGDTKLGMMEGTSPSITALPGGGWQAAFQANTSNLWIVGQDNRGDTKLGMMEGTSPSITALPGGGWQAAFQANTSNLWIVGQDNRGDTKLGMMEGTSPSITALPGGGWQAAFQANSGNLWIVGQDNRGDTKLGMMEGTSPSITALPGGGWQAAFQANTSNLWIVGQDNRGDTKLGMMEGTSPSITALPGGGWQAAFQANSGNLWIVGQDNRGDTKLGMMEGTSPSITALPGGGWQAAFQANSGNLWIVGQDNRGDTKLGMKEGTSPSLTSV